MKKNKAYVIPHTHWDREWRYPIWRNRKLLLDFFDSLLDILNNDDAYKNFLLDGQCAPVEDYLEIRPERRSEVEEFIRQGRISTGPWYTLPDLYPVDGESLVRNLLKGQELARKYGNGLRVAYMTFGWGQTAQLPQIYNGFGMDFIICAKKVSEERAPYAEFIWESPDGTGILTSRLGEHARANLFFNSYIDTRYGVSFFSDDFHYSPGRAGQAMHNASAEKRDLDYFLINPKQHWDTEGLDERLYTALKATDDTLTPETRLLLNGCDFSSPQPELTRFLKDAEQAVPDWEFVNSNLEDYAEDLKKSIKGKDIPLVKGELRDGPSCDCSGNALASRIHIKQLNKEVQRLYFRMAEPLNSLLSLIGLGDTDQLLPIALMKLLDSHPHDSINGVTQDKTADDVVNRLLQAEEICQVVYDRSIEKIISNLDMRNYSSDDQVLFLFNPSPRKERSVIEVCIDTPAGESIWDFSFVDIKGNPLKVQNISRIEHNTPVHDLESRPWPYKVIRHNVWLETPEIPAYGYTLARMTEKTTFHRDRYYWLPMRTSIGQDISPMDNVLENSHLRAEIKTNGTIDMLDKKQNKWYRGLHYFEDSGDVGNYWAYYEPYNNKTVTTLGTQALISRKTNGPLCGEYEIEWNLSIPEGADEPDFGVEGPSRRSMAVKNMKIQSTVTLKKDSSFLEIQTNVSNQSRCHRLRAAFPTGIQADFSAASGHFTVDQRPIEPVREAGDSFYPEMQTLPMQEFVDISDGELGLALLNKGLTEYEVRPDEKRTAYLTLFRAVNNMIVTGWRAINRFHDQKGSQMLGDLSFSYALYPHEGDYSAGNVSIESRKFSTGISPYQICGPSAGNLPIENGFLELEPKKLELSAVKPAEEGNALIIRLYNPTGKAVEGIVRTTLPVNKVSQLRIDETFETGINMIGNEIKLTLQPYKIITLALENV